MPGPPIPTLPRYYFRNYSQDDIYVISCDATTDPLSTLENVGFDTPAGKQFKGWCVSQDGSTTIYNPGDYVESDVYAIWEDISEPVKYSTTDVELTSIADAIRAKGGTSAALSYPTGFVSAIQAIPSMTSGTAGTPVATKGTAANHSITVTPTVTNTTGYITGGTLTGSVVTISASELVSGSLSILQNGTVDVTNYASAVVNVSGGGDTSMEDALAAATLSTYTNLRVSNVGGFACQTQLKSVAFPNCTEIKSYAFFIVNGLTGALSQISFPKCTQIGASAFYNQKMTDIYFPECLSIGTHAFGNNYSLITASFPKCTYIGYAAFYACSSLVTVSFPSVKTAYSSCFYNCRSLKEISLPECTTIGNRAFNNCFALSSIYAPKCAVVSDNAFYNCSSLTAVSFSLCWAILPSAFGNCYLLSSVDLIACNRIGSSAFANCRSLSMLSLPSCSTIFLMAFSGCVNLISLYLMGNVVVSLASTTAFNSTPIGGYSASAGQFGSIYVPSSLLTTYQSATNWSVFSSRFVGIATDFVGGGSN